MQTAAMYSDFGALANLRTDARQNSDAAMHEVASQFESLFVQMMLKSMRDATEKGGLFDSHQLETYEQMYDQQLALELSRQGGIGLAEVIVEQFQGPAAATGAAQTDAAPDAADALKPLGNYRVPSLPTIQPRIAAQPGTAGVAAAAGQPDWSAETQADFLHSLRPHAEEAAASLGVDADVLLAQAALETGWGKHVISKGQRSSNNFFNIKAGSDWQGETVTRSTHEYRDGVAVRESAQFRVYPSAQAAFADYAEFVAGRPRYAPALEAAPDSAAYLRELQRAGYATDPAYADKIMAVKQRFAPEAEQLALKNSSSGSITP